MERIDDGESKGLAREAADQFDVSPSYTNRLLRDLVDEGMVEAKGATRARSYALTFTRATRTFQLAGLQEDLVWRDFVEPHLANDLSDRALALCQHGITEMVNNAVDHSEGTACVVGVTRDAAKIYLLVSDDGVGLFEKIRAHFRLDDARHAVIELSKGKLTTDPTRHTGEGIFFTSRMYDDFLVSSGAYSYVRTEPYGDATFEETEPVEGTTIGMTLLRKSRRTLQEVFDRFTSGEEGDYSFSVTHFPVQLAVYGQENLISRSQAKRLVARFEMFKTVVLDFGGVEMIGQAFADELFRVFVARHPEVKLVPEGANRAVRNMIRRSRASDSS